MNLYRPSLTQRLGYVAALLTLSRWSFDYRLAFSHQTTIGAVGKKAGPPAADVLRNDWGSGEEAARMGAGGQEITKSNEYFVQM